RVALPMNACPLRFPAFPYTTLFRSVDAGALRLRGPDRQRAREVQGRRAPCDGRALLPDRGPRPARQAGPGVEHHGDHPRWTANRSEEHTSELQSRVDLVCRLLLEKK